MKTVIDLVKDYRFKVRDQKMAKKGVLEIRAGLKKMEALEYRLEMEAMDILGDIHQLTGCEDVYDVLENPGRYESCSTVAG